MTRIGFSKEDELWFLCEAETKLSAIEEEVDRLKERIRYLEKESRRYWTARHEKFLKLMHQHELSERRERDGARQGNNEGGGTVESIGGGNR